MKKIDNIMRIEILLKILTVLCLTFAVCLCTISASCKIDPEGITILDSDYTTPKLLNIQISNSHEISLEFDKEISLKELEVRSVSNPNATSKVDVTNINKDKFFTLKCDNKFLHTDNYEVFGVAADEKYNTLTFSSILTGYNENIPIIAFSELRTYYQKPKLEFLELIARTSGNLAGMVLEIYYKDRPVEFVFPDVEVKSGDFIIVHGRKIEETCINESTNLDEATYKDAVSGVLDFWLDSDSKVIGNSGVILLRNRKNGEPVEALLYTEPSKDDWGTSYLREAAEEAVQAEVWIGSSSVEDAAINVKPSGTRSLSRDFSISEATSLGEEVFSKDMWIFVNNGNATMGKENSLVPFEG